MNLFYLVSVALAGGIGAALRYFVDNLALIKSRSRYPLGTLVVNASGSFLLGALVGANATGFWATVIGVGLLGGYTTFSTALLETVLLYSNPARASHLETRFPHSKTLALAHSLGMMLICLVLALAGMALFT